MKKYGCCLIMFVILGNPISGQWHYESRIDDIDGYYKLAYNLGTKPTNSIKTPVLVINYIEEKAEKNVYLKNIENLDCAKLTLDFLFDDQSHIHADGETLITDNRQEMLFLNKMRRLDFFIDQLKKRDSMTVVIKNDCKPAAQFHFSLSGADEAIDFVLGKRFKKPGIIKNIGVDMSGINQMDSIQEKDTSEFKTEEKTANHSNQYSRMVETKNLKFMEQEVIFNSNEIPLSEREYTQTPNEEPTFRKIQFFISKYGNKSFPDLELFGEIKKSAFKDLTVYQILVPGPEYLEKIIEMGYKDAFLIEN